MTAVQAAEEPGDNPGSSSRRYKSVNGEWPAGKLPPFTFQEGTTATKRLWRKFTGRRFPHKIVETSGRRQTWVRRGVFYLNLRTTANSYKGWKDLVHTLSHMVNDRLYRSGHSISHSFLEKEMVKYVVVSGWLDGKLKSPERPQRPPPDKQAVRLDRARASIKRWESKLRRAQNALKKLRRTVKYYERKGMT